MQKVMVERVPVPAEAIRGHEFVPIDYADAFGVAVLGDSGQSIQDLARHVFGKIESFPNYVKWLLKLRDFLVRPFGIKTETDLQREADQGNRVGFFRIYHQSDDELILGEDDKHLALRCPFCESFETGRFF